MLKKRESRLEKIGASLVAIGVMMLIVHSIISMDIAWLGYVLFIPAFYGLMLTILSFKPSFKPEDRNIKPFVSILIPAHNEENVIEKCISSMSKINYYARGERNYEIIAINDGSSDKTGKILEKLRDELDFLTIITRRPSKAGKGKGFALNDGLKICNGKLIVVFDADAWVGPDFLEKVVPYFSDKKVAGVQTQVRMYNKDKNVLTSMQDVEFNIFDNVIQKSRCRMGLTAFLGGNGQVTRKDLIEAIGGWDGHALTEDLNLSVKFMISGWKICYCGETAIYQEGVLEYKRFFRQRLRWAMENLETFFVYLKRILSTENVPIHERIEVILFLSYPIFLCFVMLGYIVAILYIGAVIEFELATPVIIGILSTVAFFPAAILGIYQDTKNCMYPFLELLNTGLTVCI
ncbi:MAG: glycosyltransferase [Methanobacteriaceae archaeon]